MAERRKVKRGKKRRKSERLEEEYEITITVLSGRENHPKVKIMYNFTMDISESGARIQANSFLPINALINIKVTLNNPPKMITALGKVKWIKSLFADEYFEAGLEFVYASREMIQQLAYYISSKQQPGKQLNQEVVNSEDN
jgi:hypothetical protein